MRNKVKQILTMSRVFPIILVFGLYQSEACLKAQKPDSLMVLANQHYVSGDFHGTITLLEQVALSGNHSHGLYYNLGNAYFRVNNFPRAILNYEKVLLLRPNDADTRHNLELANARVTDKIDELPQWFLQRWVATIGLWLGPNLWALLSMVLFGLAILTLLFFVITRKTGLRKGLFALALLLLLLFLITLFYTLNQTARIRNPRQAIVFAPTLNVRSTPNETGASLFMLHEGTKVELLDSLNRWYEISIANGNRGWVKVETIEKVKL